MERKKKHGERENQTAAPISLKSPMPYPSPTVTLKLHCEQFWAFIVIVTFDLLRTLLRMCAYEQTDKDNYRGLQVGCHKFATRIRACAEFSIQNPHQKLRMREFSLLICDNQPANLCIS